MKKQLEIEFGRIFFSRTLWVSLTVGLIIVVAQFVTNVYPYALNPLRFWSYDAYPANVFTYWIGGMGAGVCQTIYELVLPILAMLPYALSYHQDMKTGYIKNIYTRTPRINYLVAKYVAVFISAGIVTVIPYMINLLAVSCVLPAINPPIEGPGEIAWSCTVFYRLKMSHPYIHIMLMLIVMFIYAGVFATTALAAATAVENIFILALVPFIVWYGLKMISANVKSLLGFYTSPTIAISTSIHISNLGMVIMLPIVVGGISAIVYFIKGVKSDAL